MLKVIRNFLWKIFFPIALVCNFSLIFVEKSYIIKIVNKRRTGGNVNRKPGVIFLLFFGKIKEDLL